MAGKFFVIEGTDGSGKGTQFKIISDWLSGQGYQVATFDFPQYNQESSYFVKKYLNGQYGSANEVGPYKASLFYALDRYEASADIIQALSEDKIVLANRYVASNMGHQGTKFNDANERHRYYLWLDKLEFETLNIPRPDMNFVLSMPANIAQQFVDQKQQRNYTDKKRDLHEADLMHLQKAVEVYDELCQLFPNNFTKIDCTKNTEILSINDVTKLLQENIMPLLPNQPSKNNQNKTNYLVTNKDGLKTITAQGKEALDEILTNSTGDVYGFYNKLDQVTVSASMARLSRRGDDMRITLLDEFIGQDGKDEGLIERVVTAYGDDSVQQLVGLHMVIENASNLLTKQIEWGRLASYLEQSTRYIYYDQKDQDGRYRYFIPTDLNKATTAKYRQMMDQLFSNYSLVVHKLTDYLTKTNTTPQNERDIAWKSAIRAQACDVARNMLPVATKSTVGVFASAQALESMIMRLLSLDSLEARNCGQSLLNEARKITPAFLQRADKPERGGATIAYKANTFKALSKLANELLPNSYASDYQDVQLGEFWPKNELDITAHMLYEHSNLSEQELKNIVSSTDYQAKLNIFNTYLGERLNRRHKPGRAFERIVYSFDIVCDYGIFRDLQRHRLVSDLTWQELSPRFGYDVPKLIEDANLTDLYQQNFDISLELYSLLQQQNANLQAQYATLMGHKMRWKITMNAREAMHFIELRTSPHGHPGYRKLAKQMHDKIAEVHPLVANAMKFVNKDEDPELTRLAAERSTQYKLQNL
jgi:thymidylate synthase ThyX/thymidylate kinase